jgi:hypothetical protein
VSSAVKFLVLSKYKEWINHRAYREQQEEKVKLQKKEYDKDFANCYNISKSCDYT